MKIDSFRNCRWIWLLVFLAGSLVPVAAADETNNPAQDMAADNYLKIQEQIHATQLIIAQSQQAAADAASSNAIALAARLQSLEQSVAAQRSSSENSAGQTERLTLFFAGAFGLVGLGIMLLMVYFQWRAFSQLAEISAQQNATLAHSSAIHQLAAPGRAAVEASNDRLLDVVAALEKRICELESGQRFLPVTAPSKTSELLAEGQKFLEINLPDQALECFDRFLAANPCHAEALVKRAVALEKLGRPEEALTNCDRAITADDTLAMAHLQKGGLLNRLRRYDEALNCFEEALRAQEKKSVARVS